jgi:hypothetical protein
MPLEAPTAERPLQTPVWRPICDVISQKAFRQAIRRVYGAKSPAVRAENAGARPSVGDSLVLAATVCGGKPGRRQLVEKPSARWRRRGKSFEALAST